MKRWKLASVPLALLMLGACGDDSETTTTTEAASDTTAADTESTTTEAFEVEEVTFVIPIKTASYVLPLLAEEQGLFDDYGIDAKIEFVPPPGGLNVLVTGDADFEIISAPTIELANLQGSDVIYVANFIHKPLVSLVTKADITSVDELEGGVIGITVPGSITQIYTDRFLRDNGLDPASDVETRPLGGQGELMQALISGQIDAAMLGSPQEMVAEGEGFNILENLADTDYLWNLAGIATQRSFAEENPEVVVRVLSALIDAAELWEAEPELVQELIMREMGVDAALAAEAYDAVTAVLDFTPIPEAADMQATLDELTFTQPEAADADPDDFFDSTYVEEALSKR